MHITAVRRGAPLCLMAVLALGFGCKNQESKDGGKTEAAESAESTTPSGPKPGEPETLSGHMYLRMTNNLGLESGPYAPMPMLLAADDSAYYLPVFPRILGIEPGATNPRILAAPRHTVLRGIYKDELILQNLEGGEVLALPKAGGETRTVAAQGFNALALLVGDRVVMVAADSVLSHVPIAGGPVETQLDQVGAQVIGDVSVRGDAILWAAQKDRPMILIARGSFEKIEVAHELTDATTPITGVAWFGDDIVFAVGEPDIAIFRKVGDTVERLAVDPGGMPLMWSDDNSVWWMTREGNAVAKAGRISADRFHELRNPPPDIFPSSAGSAWSAELDGVTNYYVNRPAPEGAVPLSLDLVDLQPLSMSLAKHYKGPEPEFEAVITSGSAAFHPKLLSAKEDSIRRMSAYCYKAALLRNPTLSGELELEIELEPKRSLYKVVKATPVGEFGNPEVVECIAETVVDTTIILKSDAKTLGLTFTMSVPAN